MKKRAIQILFFLLILLSSKVKAQNLTYEWNKPNPVDQGTTISPNDTIFLLLRNPSTSEDITNFLKITKVKVNNDEKSLYDRIDAVDRATLKKLISDKSIGNLELKKYLPNELKDSDVIVISAYTGKDANNQPYKNNIATIIIKEKNPDKSNGDTLNNEKCFVPDKGDSVYINNIIDYETQFEYIKKPIKQAGTSIPCDCINSKAIDTTCEPISANLLKNVRSQYIYYDFENKTFFNYRDSSPLNFARKKIYYNDAIQIKILNINRFRNSIQLNATNVDFDSDVPPLLQNFLWGDTAGLLGTAMKAINIGNGTSLSSSHVDPKSSTKCGSRLNWTSRTLQLSIIEYYKMLNYLRQQELDATNACKKFPTCCDIPQSKIAEQYEILLNVVQNIKAIANDVIIQSKDDTNKSSEEIEKNAKTLQESLPTNKEIYDLLQFIQEINKNNNEFLTPPIYATGNRLEISIKTSKIGRIAVGNDTTTDQPYYLDFPVLWKPFVSFSAGTFIALDRHLQEITYDFERIPSSGNVVGSSGNYRMVQTGYSKLPVGFDAFINLETKVYPAIGIGVSAGVGVTVEDKPRIAYLAGGSLFLGDLKQFAFTMGFAGMQVDKLDKNFETYYKQQVAFQESAKPASVQYYNDFKVGGFISLSYTPFKVNRRPVYNANMKAKEQAIASATAAEEVKNEKEKAEAKVAVANAQGDAAEKKEAASKAEESTINTKAATQQAQ